MEEAQIRQYEFVVNIKLGIIAALSNIAQEGRTKFLNEIMPIIDDLNVLYTLTDRNKLQEMNAQKKHKEEVHMQALMDVIKSGKGVSSNYADIINELNKTIHSLDSEAKNSETRK